MNYPITVVRHRNFSAMRDADNFIKNIIAAKSGGKLQRIS